MPPAACGRAGLPGREEAGAVLLEVVLALTVFVGMAMAVLASLATSVHSARHVGLEARAADLAVTRLSEMELGLVPIEDAGPEAYEDEALADWTWQITVLPDVSELPDLDITRVEVAVRHTPSGYTFRTHRMLTTSAEEPADDLMAEAFE
jgi:hypothetical protein